MKIRKFVNDSWNIVKFSVDNFSYYAQPEIREVEVLFFNISTLIPYKNTCPQGEWPLIT